MPAEEPEKGDKVSWNWGGGAPGGTVAEKKEKGEVAITSKRGNKIKKNAEPNDPAVHIERSGNDVVKKASELNVEKKASGGTGDSEKKDDDNKGEKRKAAEDDQDPHVKNAEGKEVKPGGKVANKKQKQDKDKDKDKESSEKPKTATEEEKKDKSEEKKDDKPEAAAEKKKPGRPRGGGESKKSKKEPTPRQEGDLVSSRTRSRGK